MIMSRIRVQRAGQRGAVLITVMVVMVLVLLFGVTVANHLTTTEAAAVDDDLVRAQLYWAKIGMVNYGLSRARATGLCCDTTNAVGALEADNQAQFVQSGPGNADVDLTIAGYLQGFIRNEPFFDAAGNNTWRWYYPRYTNNPTIDDANNATIDVQATVDDRDEDAGATTGEVELELHVFEAGTVPIYAELDALPEANRERLRFGICFYDVQESDTLPPIDGDVDTWTTQGCQAPVGIPTNTEGDLTTNRSDEGHARIQFVMRRFP